MSRPAKGMTTGAIGMLLGAGLCGLDRVTHGNAYGGVASIAGAGCITLSFLVLLISFFVFVFQELSGILRRRR